MKKYLLLSTLISLVMLVGCTHSSDNIKSNDIMNKSIEITSISLQLIEPRNEENKNQSLSTSCICPIPYYAPDYITVPEGSPPYMAKIAIEVKCFIVTTYQPIVFKAGQSIELKPFFEVQRGAYFDANIAPVSKPPPPPPPPDDWLFWGL